VVPYLLYYDPALSTMQASKDAGDRRRIQLDESKQYRRLPSPRFFHDATPLLLSGGTTGFLFRGDASDADSQSANLKEGLRRRRGSRN
jgi:hypothetical protein